MIIGANPSKILDYGVDMLMEPPENFSELDDATKARPEYQVYQSTLIDPYQTVIYFTN